jgi:transcriptional regulator with XRE-family HTH domain
MSSESTPTGRQIAAARELLGMTRADLASVAGVHRNTIITWESGERLPRRETYARVLRALEARGVEFLNGRQPGVRLNPDKTEQ